MNCTRHSGNSISNILDIPNEILVKIILNLNARERVPLGNTCKRFYNLVFEEKELLRDLDFSKNGRLTSSSDIKKYFANAKTSKHVLKLNLRNVNCMEPEKMLNDYIRKAVNLVSINIQGTKLDDIEELASFLKYLHHIEQLSVDWPRKTSESNDGAIGCYKILRKPFSKLTHLSVRMWHVPHSKIFVRYLLLCQRLKELRMVGRKPYILGKGEDPLTSESKKLKNLELVEFCGACLGGEKEYFVSLLPNPKEWTDFQVPNYYSGNGFYLERNVKVCDEILESELWMQNRCIDEENGENLIEVGGIKIGLQSISSEYLLQEIVKITHEEVPEEFCCLSPFRDTDICLVKIDEQKRLLKDPRYGLRHLHINHNIEVDCDAHLLASAFPNLKELVLSNITKALDSEMKYPDKRLRKKSTSLESDMRNVNLDSSFKMLVENTPNIEKLILNTDDSSLDDDETWDLSSLPQIAGWKNLRILSLSSVPIEDGNFLIEIGKECENLEILELFDLGPWASCCYINELLEIFNNCLKNLREFTMRQDNIGQISKLFDSLNKNDNVKLKRVSLISEGEINNAEDLVPSVERLLRRSPNLTTFECIIDELSENDSIELTSILQNLKNELKRPAFQFQVVWSMDFVVDDSEALKEGVIREDAATLTFPSDMIRTVLYS